VCQSYGKTNYSDILSRHSVEGIVFLKACKGNNLGYVIAGKTRQSLSCPLLLCMMLSCNFSAPDIITYTVLTAIRQDSREGRILTHTESKVRTGCNKAVRTSLNLRKIISLWRKTAAVGWKADAFTRLVYLSTLRICYYRDGCEVLQPACLSVCLSVRIYLKNTSKFH